MGFFNIPLKPSTAIIFSIVFGITVDNTIHFLAKYRYEIFHHKRDREEALRMSIMDAGPSIVYTSIVLFFGFLIFAFSNFGGTKALGILTSVTLFTAMITSFTILPVLILSFDRGRNEKDYEGVVDEYEGDFDENALGSAPKNSV
jgi:predicted RND superfamily exporter protein